jgi:hypothetical protein
MTAEEAMTLPVGDVVEALVTHQKQRWVRAMVVITHEGTAFGRLLFGVRREGLNANGKPYCAVMLRRRNELRLVRHLEPLPANVYADFLDDRGQHEAARMLREAFPLGPPADVASTG